ncbi:MAG: GntR family transcriptional regulator [Lachnospiraceae bacterium]|nr:GntR family transcriptional regulator [Lachnospiraceae bacterium]
MLIEIDFNSDEAIYMQLRNQIIFSIASNRLHEGETLPSVRQLAEEIGINMHTVNKAYSVLKQDGFVKLDRRHGAMVAIDIDKIAAMKEMSDELAVIVAKAICKNVSREEAHNILDGIYDMYEL